MARTSTRGRRKHTARAAAAGPRLLWIGIGVAVVIIVVLFAYGAVRQQAREDALAAALEGVEEFPSEGAQHVAEGTEIEYRTSPPTSGPHYDRPASPQFYEPGQVPAAGHLVHNLEHGHIVIYYDPERTSQEALDYVRDLTERYRGSWDAVVAVPRRQEPYELILTAWQHMLRLETFDRERVDAFVDRFRGRGPENPVR